MSGSADGLDHLRTPEAMKAREEQERGVQTLLPCPFCGTAIRDDEQDQGLENWLQVTAASGMYRVECFGCGVEARSFDTPQEAIAAWNRRHPGDALRSGAVTLNEARAARGLLPLDLLPCADVLVAKISSEEIAQTGSLIERALRGPEEGRVEVLRELMRYTRQVLGIPEPEGGALC